MHRAFLSAAVLLCTLVARGDATHYQDHSLTALGNVMLRVNVNRDSGGTGPALANLPTTFDVAGDGSNMLTPLAVYLGKDAGASTWADSLASGDTLNVSGSGTAPTTGQYTPFPNATDKSVLFNAGKYYAPTSTSYADYGTTKDLILEIVFKGDINGGTLDVIGKYGGASKGFLVQLGANTGHLYTGQGNITCTMTDLTWNHIVYAIRQGGYNACWINGVATTSAASSGTNATTTGAMRVGDSGGNGYKHEIAYVALWEPTSGTLPSASTTLDAVVASRFKAMIAVNARTARGAVAGSLGGAANKYVDVDADGDGTRRLFALGTSWLGTARRNVGGTYFTGYLIEEQTTNKFLRSQTFDNASWTASQAGDSVTANTDAAPDNTTSGDAYDAAVDLVGLTHCLRQAVTLTAASYTESVYVKKGVQAWAYLNDASISNAKAWFDINTCTSATAFEVPSAVGTTQSAVTAKAYHVDANWCRIAITFTGTAASHNLDMCGASGDNSTTYTEALGGEADISFWQADVVQKGVISSPIRTTTATVTRSSDGLTYAAANNFPSNLPATVIATVAPLSYTPIADHYIWAESASASTTDQSYAKISSSTGKCNTTGTATSTTQWSLDCASSIADGAIHTIRVNIDKNAAAIYRDGTSDGTDATVTIPGPGTPTIYVGENESTAKQSGMLIGSVTVINSIVPGTAGSP